MTRTAEPAPAPAVKPARPSVSVIVPCYNYGHVLEGCVASVLAQEGVDLALLIIDDLSSDDSAAVCATLAASDGRIEFRQHTENRGLIATANEGLQWAQGDYVVLLSADDQLVRGALRRATTVMSEHPRVGMVYGRPLLALEGRPMPKPSGRWRGTQIWSGADWIAMRCRSGHSCISSPEAVVRNSVARAVGGYDPDCYHTSDLNMWMRIAAIADIAHIRGVPQAIYRIHSASMLRSQDGSLIDLRERRNAFASFFDSCSGKLDRPERLRARAMAVLARQALWQASRAVDRGTVENELDELIAFALETYPDSRRLREWWGLQLRQRLGAGRSLAFFPFILTGGAHRLRHHLNRASWRLRGV